MNDISVNRYAASFRDPDGYIFQYQGEYYRYVSMHYKESYDQLVNSGLYERLIQENLLIPHQEVSNIFSFDKEKQPYKILKPAQLSVISYPYEWSFSQLKEAALTMLKIQSIAREYRMDLKDASVFNIQLFKGRPVLIDSLSFRPQPILTEPWLALGQFYRHFLWPLLVMSHVNIHFNKQFILNLDGFKIDEIQSWFGLKSYLNLSLLTHVHLHYFISKIFLNSRVLNKSQKPGAIKLNANGVKIILERISNLIGKLEIKQNTTWKEYYQNTNYVDGSFLDKELQVKRFIKINKNKIFIDFGANNGHFSLLAEAYCDRIYALDFDPMAIDSLYRSLSLTSKQKIIPLIVDLSNPSPSIGWALRERNGILNRLPSDAAGLVLALTHHLHITYNINFELQARFFAQYCNELIIEFIAPEDLQVIKLFNNRYDQPLDYTQAHFELAFELYYDVVSYHLIQNSKRTLYCLRRK